MTIYTLHFSGKVGRYKNEAAAAAALTESKGISFTMRPGFDMALASARGEFQVMIYNTMLQQAQSAGLEIPAKAEPVKKFASRQIALDRIFRLAMSFGDQAPEPMPEPNVVLATAEGFAVEQPEEAPLGGWPSITVVQDGVPPQTVAPEAPRRLLLVPAPDTLAKAVEGAEAAALADPSPSAVARASDLPDQGAPTDEVIEQYEPDTILCCPVCLTMSGLIMTGDELTGCNDCGWKLGDPTEPTNEVNEMATKKAAKAAKKTAVKTPKAPKVAAADAPAKRTPMTAKQIETKRAAWFEVQKIERGEAKEAKAGPLSLAKTAAYLDQKLAAFTGRDLELPTRLREQVAALAEAKAAARKKRA